MPAEKDPALSQEDVAAGDVDTTAVPQAEGDDAEGSGTETGSPQEDQKTQTKEEAKPESEPEETEITLEGEESPPAVKDPAPAWAKELRKKYREVAARNEELERALQAHGQPAAADPGAKPTLADCDFDTGVYEQKLESWHEAKRRKDAAEAQATQQAQAAQAAYQAHIVKYNQQKAELTQKIPQLPEYQAAVESMLNVLQQGILVRYARNKALVVAALGQRPELLKDLADTKDPGDVIAKIVELEGRLKMAKKTQAPPPEKPVRGSGSTSGTVDSTLERLRAEADKTGDVTKILEYKRQRKQQAR